MSVLFYVTDVIVSVLKVTLWMNVSLESCAPGLLMVMTKDHMAAGLSAGSLWYGVAYA